MLYAINLHSDQVRKGTDVPYVSHLLAVSALVMEDGGDEDEVIAALLHDAPEDQGGRDTLEEIRDLFGEKVAEIVDGCTDTYQNPKPPWRHRKESYIERIIHTYRERIIKEKYSYVASLDEIRENDYNLNIPRYVDTFEEEEPVDLLVVSNDLKELAIDMKETDVIITDYCKQVIPLWYECR